VPIHRRQRIEIAVHVEKVDLRSHGRTVRQCIDQPLARKPHQRFADRRARHAEALGKLHLVDGAAGRQFQVQNLVPQDIVDHLHAGAALALVSEARFIIHG